LQFPVLTLCLRLIPETKGRSLEEMDIIFGAVSAEKRQADINATLQHENANVRKDDASSADKV
jgi:hypothetical protein